MGNRQQEVLSWIIGMGAYGSPKPLRPRDCGEDLGLSLENASVVFRQLVRIGAIVDLGRPDGGTTHVYMAVKRVHQIPANKEISDDDFWH